MTRSMRQQNAGAQVSCSSPRGKLAGAHDAGHGTYGPLGMRLYPASAPVRSTKSSTTCRPDCSRTVERGAPATSLSHPALICTVSARDLGRALMCLGLLVIKLVLIHKAQRFPGSCFQQHASTYGFGPSSNFLRRPNPELACWIRAGRARPRADAFARCGALGLDVYRRALGHR